MFDSEVKGLPGLGVALKMAKNLEADADRMEAGQLLNGLRAAFVARRVENGSTIEAIRARALIRYMDYVETLEGVELERALMILTKMSEPDMAAVMAEGRRAPQVVINNGAPAAAPMTVGPMIEGRTPSNPVKDAGAVHEALQIIGHFLGQRPAANVTDVGDVDGDA